MYPLNLHCKVFFTEITRLQKCSISPMLAHLQGYFDQDKMLIKGSTKWCEFTSELFSVHNFI